jgi:hypothetical protein
LIGALDTLGDVTGAVGEEHGGGVCLGRNDKIINFQLPNETERAKRLAGRIACPFGQAITQESAHWTTALLDPRVEFTVLAVAKEALACSPAATERHHHASDHIDTSTKVEGLWRVVVLLGLILLLLLLLQAGCSLLERSSANRKVCPEVRYLST